VKLPIEAHIDGSSLGNPGPGGWGVILTAQLPRGTHTRELSGHHPHATNNEMEITAALRAVEAVKQPAILFIRTDSKLVHGWLDGTFKCRKAAILNILHQITAAALERGVEIRTSLVPGHAGVALNERAHALAHAAARAGGKEA
jgi:ribonuclease HI